MSVLDTGLIAPVTASQMVEAYRHACAVVRSSFGDVAEAEQRLVGAFGDDYGSWKLVGDHRHPLGHDLHWDAANPAMYVEAVIKSMRRMAWGKIVNITGVKKMMSAQRIEDMEGRMAKDELPEISEAAIFDMLALMADSAPEIATEIIKAAYDAIRPMQWATLKTQQRTRDFGVQRKVILGYMLDHRFPNGVQVAYRARTRLAEIDKAFHLLDGQGVPDGYITPLVDAVNGEEWSGATDYFKFKKYKNGNLHLEFLRQDLLDNFNRVAGGGALHR